MTRFPSLCSAAGAPSHRGGPVCVGAALGAGRQGAGGAEGGAAEHAAATHTVPGGQCGETVTGGGDGDGEWI